MKIFHRNVIADYPTRFPIVKNEIKNFQNEILSNFYSQKINECDLKKRLEFVENCFQKEITLKQKWLEMVKKIDIKSYNILHLFAIKSWNNTANMPRNSIQIPTINFLITLIFFVAIIVAFFYFS